MKTIYTEINNECTALMESVTEISILQENVGIGIVDQQVLNEAFEGVKEKFTSLINKIKTMIQSKIAARKKKKDMIAKYGEVIKAAKKLTVANDAKVKLHEGSNTKMKIHVPSKPSPFINRLILDTMKDSSEDNMLRSVFSGEEGQKSMRQAIAVQLKEVVPSFSKDEATAKECTDAVKAYYLGDVVTVKPAIADMVSNLTQAPKVLDILDRVFLQRANDISKTFLEKVNALGESQSGRQGLQSTVKVLNVTVNNMIQLNELVYDVVCTIAEEDYTALRSLSKEAGAINEAAIETPDYCAGDVEETTDAVVYQDAIGADKETSSASTVQPDTVGSIIPENKEKDVVVQESAMFDNVLALLESQSELLFRGLKVMPLTEAVDMEEYYQHAALLEAVDELTVDKTAIEEAKQGKGAKIKSALEKIKNYLFSLDPDKKGKLLPKVIKLIVAGVMGSLISSAILVSSPAAAGAALLASFCAGVVLGIADHFVTVAVNRKDIDATIASLEARIADLGKKIEGDKANDKLVAAKKDLEKALVMFKKLKPKDKEASKVVNESADDAANVISVVQPDNAGKVEETNDGKANVAAIGAGKAASQTVVQPDTVGSIIPQGKEGEVSPLQEAAFEKVVTLIESQVEALMSGQRVRPLVESVDLDECFEHVALLEAVDTLTIDKEAMTEAKQGKFGKLKAAIHKITEHFLSLDPAKRGKLFPNVLDAVVSVIIWGVIITNVSGVVPVMFAAYALGTMKQIIRQALVDNYNQKDVERAVTSLEARLEEVNKKISSNPDNKDLKKIREELNSALMKFKKLKDKKDINDAGKKAINESTYVYALLEDADGANTIPVVQPDNAGKVEETNDSSVNVDAIGAGKVASQTVVQPDTVGSVIADKDADDVKPLTEGVTMVELYI